MEKIYEVECERRESFDVYTVLFYVAGESHANEIDGVITDVLDYTDENIEYLYETVDEEFLYI